MGNRENLLPVFLLGKFVKNYVEGWSNLKKVGRNVRGLGRLPWRNFIRLAGRLRMVKFTCVRTQAVLAMIVTNSVQ